MKSHLFAALLASLVVAGTNVASAEKSDETISIIQADKMEWMDYPGLPGVQFVVVAGNPREAGPYVIRAKFAPHTMSRPHWHPEARFVTVIKGTWWAGAGENFDPEKTTPVPMGGFAIHAPGKVHYDGAKDEEAIVQITGIGPSGTHVVNPGDVKNK
ncbi:MAG: cupin domain-containing protein [Burkholderiales bacterium]